MPMVQNMMVQGWRQGMLVEDSRKASCTDAAADLLLPICFALAA
jgi:hypothetical protein